MGLDGKWIISDDGEIRAIAEINMLNKNSAQIAYFEVGANSKGFGIGASLMQNIIKEADKEKIFLFVNLNEQNKDMIAAYEAAGFEIQNVTVGMSRKPTQ